MEFDQPTPTDFSRYRMDLSEERSYARLPQNKTKGGYRRSGRSGVSGSNVGCGGREFPDRWFFHDVFIRFPPFS